MDADSFAFDVLFGRERRSRRALMDAETWFDRRDAGRFELYEQSIKIGDDEVLTLLIFTDEEMLEETA